MESRSRLPRNECRQRLFRKKTWQRLLARCPVQKRAARRQRPSLRRPKSECCADLVHNRLSSVTQASVTIRVGAVGWSVAEHIEAASPGSTGYATSFSRGTELGTS